MILNHEEIKAKRLLSNFDSNNFKNASYDLRVDKIISVDGKILESFQIQPNTMVVIISKEKIELPYNIIGHAYVKTRLSQKGIMANNIGIVDPGYVGPLSTVLINFGKEPFQIDQNVAFLRITFTTFNTPTANCQLEYGTFERQAYEKDRRIEAMSYLGNSFINIDRIFSKLKTDLIKLGGKIVLVLSLVFAGISTALSAYQSYKSENDILKENVENLQKQVNVFNSNQNSLLELQEKYEKALHSFVTEIDSIQKEKKHVSNTRK
ncbi:MAG: hypothetical protein H6Q15_2289 [Bacteroidetes bacterium]|nr:hypothetical protein [Bacteroidota bacterium]